MDYAERYYAEFKEVILTDSTFPAAQFRVSFQYADYSGEASELEVYDEKPVTIGITGTGSNIYDPILAKKATFRLRTHDLDTANSFYVTDNRAIKVVISADYAGGSNYDTIEFIGWLLPAALSYDYKKPPFALEVSAACGLSTIKETPLLSELGKRMINRASITHVLQTALLHTDVSFKLLTACNTYEISDVAANQVDSNGVADMMRDPLWQTLLPTDELLTDKYEPKNCYDVIGQHCPTFLLRVAQIRDGRWGVFRVPELGGGFDKGPGATATSVRARSYDSEVPGPGPVSHASIDLNVYTSPTGDLRVLNRSPKTGLQGIKDGVRIEQKYGKTISLIPNADFAIFDSTGLPDHWTALSLPASDRFVVGSGTNASPYGLRILNATDKYVKNDTPAMRVTMDYTRDSPEFTTNIKRTFKCEFDLFNARGAKIWFIAEREGKLFMYANPQDWLPFQELRTTRTEAIVTDYFKTVLGVETSKTGKGTINIEIKAVDRIDRLHVYLGQPLGFEHPTSNATSYITYYNPRFEYEEEGLNLDGMQVTIVRPGKTVKEASLTLIVGDVPKVVRPELKQGTLFHRNGNPTRLWFKADANPGGVGNGVSSGRTLLDLVASNYAKQTMIPAGVANVTLIGRNPWGPLSVLHIDDAPELGAMIWTQWEWDLRKCTHTGAAQTLMSGADDSAIPATQKEWQTPDGEVPQNAGDDGEPVEPAKNGGRLSATDQQTLDLIRRGVLPGGGRVLPVIPGYTLLSTNDPQGGVIPIVGGVKKSLIPAIAWKQIDLSKLIGGG